MRRGGKEEGGDDDYYGGDDGGGENKLMRAINQSTREKLNMYNYSI